MGTTCGACLKFHPWIPHMCTTWGSANRAAVQLCSLKYSKGTRRCSSSIHVIPQKQSCAGPLDRVGALCSGSIVIINRPASQHIMRFPLRSNYTVVTFRRKNKCVSGYLVKKQGHLGAPGRTRITMWRITHSHITSTPVFNEYNNVS